MTIRFESLNEDVRTWLDHQARQRGTTIVDEAARLLDEAVHDRIRRDAHPIDDPAEAALMAELDRARLDMPGVRVTELEVLEAKRFGQK